MKATDKIMLTALLVSAVLTGAIYWWIPDMHWGAYLGVWFVLSAAGYSQFLKTAAQEAQVNANESTSKS